MLSLLFFDYSKVHGIFECSVVFVYVGDQTVTDFLFPLKLGVDNASKTQEELGILQCTGLYAISIF